MKNFSTNYSEILLLANQKILIWDNDSDFITELVPMKVKDVFTNLNLSWFLNFLEQDINDLKKHLNDNEIETHFDFIQLICGLSELSKETNDLANRFIESFQIILPDVTLQNKIIMIKNKIFTVELFDLFLKIVFKIMNKKITEPVIETDDEMTKKMKAMQKRIQDIKRKGRKINEGSTKFEDMFAALLYEYPQYKMEDLFELNIYTFYYLFKYVGKIANYEVSKIAAGNGLTKKHKYFIEK